MAIPIFEDFLYPFLAFVGEKDMTTKEIRQAIIEKFNLTEEDCAQKTRNGTSTQLNDRINWTRQYLRRALFIDLPSRGVYRISSRGREYLQSHTDLRKKDLMEYPEFASYATGNPNVALEREAIPIQNDHDDSPVVTPTEQLESAMDLIYKDLSEELLQKILEQSPYFFEHLVLDLLSKMGYGSAEVTPYVHDDGIDGIIYEDKLGLEKIYIQAKRYKSENKVGKPEVQQFSGALDEQKATKGVFITTSDFSKEARSFQVKTGKQIVLISGEELTRYMIEYNVGVSVKKTYELKKIDTDYFE